MEVVCAGAGASSLDSGREVSEESSIVCNSSDDGVGTIVLSSSEDICSEGAARAVVRDEVSVSVVASGGMAMLSGSGSSDEGAAGMCSAGVVGDSSTETNVESSASSGVEVDISSTGMSVESAIFSIAPVGGSSTGMGVSSTRTGVGSRGSRCSTGVSAMRTGVGSRGSRCSTGVSAGIGFTSEMISRV